MIILLGRSCTGLSDFLLVSCPIDAWMPGRRRADHDIYRQAASEKGVFKARVRGSYYNFLLLHPGIEWDGIVTEGTK